MCRLLLLFQICSREVFCT
ncbi:hypothetical protein F383_12295 [Gossypium arboreum]|uniref:Uncharacterized protein n=1 Tax=Gossypium arboreum TaxID=29729 RepID=A0A0B0NDG3_GOSAR|nr:hypothetical protein F383_12295 [Gossypium arboreum]